MLTSKRCTGYFEVFLHDGQVMQVEPHELGFTNKQEWRVFQDPARYTWQGAHFLCREIGEDDVNSVYAHANCSLNGGPSQPYINSSVDLLSIADDILVGSAGK